MGVPSNPDTATLNDWLQALNTSTALDMQSVLFEFTRRFQITPQLSASGGFVVTGRQEWEAHIRAGRAFGNGNIVAAVAANFGLQQLFNPANSGVRLLVYFLDAQPSGASDVTVAFDTAESAAARGAPPNLKQDGPASAAHFRRGAVAARPGTLGQAISYFQITGQPRVATPPPGGQGFLADIPPGVGLDVFAEVANIALAANLFWAEVTTSFP